MTDEELDRYEKVWAAVVAGAERGMVGLQEAAHRHLLDALHVVQDLRTKVARMQDTLDHVEDALRHG